VEISIFYYQYFDEARHANSEILHDFRILLQEIVEFQQDFEESLQACAALLQAWVKFLHEIAVFLQ